jgi:hypothetical protein
MRPPQERLIARIAVLSGADIDKLTSISRWFVFGFADVIVRPRNSLIYKT